jgi:hypothetical protein
MRQQGYTFPPAIFAPISLTVLSGWFGYSHSWWSLAAIPFIWLGAWCSAPNLNLADGCLFYLAMIIGFGNLIYFKTLGLAIMAGAVSGYVMSALEKSVRMRPIKKDDE